MDEKMKYVMPVIFMMIFFLLFSFSGCKTTPVKYSLETATPDVWASEPTQNLKVKIEFTR